MIEYLFPYYKQKKKLRLRGQSTQAYSTPPFTFETIVTLYNHQLAPSLGLPMMCNKHVQTSLNYSSTSLYRFLHTPKRAHLQSHHSFMIQILIFPSTPNIKTALFLFCSHILLYEVQPVVSGPISC